MRNVPETYVEKLENNPDITVYKKEATKLGYLAYATDKEPFNDARVRRAINHALNREEIIQFVLRELEKLHMAICHLLLRMNTLKKVVI